jgi:hypothetical protein
VCASRICSGHRAYSRTDTCRVDPVLRGARHCRHPVASPDATSPRRDESVATSGDVIFVIFISCLVWRITNEIYRGT